MRSSTLTALAPLAFTMVSVGCYDDDVRDNIGTANNALDAICLTMSGWFEPQQWRTGCGGIDTEDTYWYFEVKQTGWGGTLTYDQCKDGLSARYCEHGQGGSNDADGWYFRSDPGKGHCTYIGYINQNPNGKRDEHAPRKVMVYTGEFRPSHDVLQAISASNQKTKRATKGKVEAPFQA